MRFYRIHPAVGIARVGNSADGFFLGAENFLEGDIELARDGSEKPLTSYKDSAGRLKRQVARFRVFEFERDAGGERLIREVTASDDVTITWRVELANLKTKESAGDDGILPGPRTITGKNARPVGFDSGKFRGCLPVYLGELRTDAAGRLLLFGGRGLAGSSPWTELERIHNKNWYDDVADGPVTATVTVRGSAPVDIAPEHSSWAVVGPPDFAPGVYDRNGDGFEVAMAMFDDPVPQTPSYRDDVLPILFSHGRYQWTTADVWDLSTDWRALGDPNEPAEPRRKIAAKICGFNPLAAPEWEQYTAPEVDAATVALATELATAIASRRCQILTKWADGNFIADYDAKGPLPGALDRANLYRISTSLAPGWEVSYPFIKKETWSSPLRIDASTVSAGTLTKDLPVPWKGDAGCICTSSGPSQRPMQVLVNNEKVTWFRPFERNGIVADKNAMLDNFRRNG